MGSIVSEVSVPNIGGGQVEICTCVEMGNIQCGRI
jgi:hypothetical protein